MEWLSHCYHGCCARSNEHVQTINLFRRRCYPNGKVPVCHWSIHRASFISECTTTNITVNVQRLCDDRRNDSNPIHTFVLVDILSVVMY